MRIITAMSIAGSINLFVIKGGFDTIDFVTKIDPLTYLMGLACLFLLKTLAARLIPFYSDTYMLAGVVFVFAYCRQRGSETNIFLSGYCLFWR